VIVTKLNLGFPDDPLQQLGMGRAPEQSAIVLLVRPGEEGYVRTKLTALGGTLIQDTLAPEMIAQLTAVADRSDQAPASTAGGLMGEQAALRKDPPFSPEPT